MKTNMVVAIALIATASATAQPDPIPPQLPFVIGPIGHWSGECPPPSAQPSPDPVITGCITAFTFRPGVVDVSVRASGMGSLDHITVLACRYTPQCPTFKNVNAANTSQYSALVPLPSPSGISRICATVQTFIPNASPPGQPPTSHYRSVPLGCVSVTPQLSAAASAFKITQTIDGLRHEGWFIDLTTDAPASIVLGRGPTPTTAVTAAAGDSDVRSSQSWPGYKSQHGFTATLPYVGSPGPAQICAWLAPNTGPSSVLGCFSYQERTLAFAEKNITRGDTLHVKVRNVRSGTAVSVNLRAEAGHFMLSWKHTNIWAATADQTGSANINISTDHLPPGRYLIAYHCAPECPGGNLNADQLAGAQPWTGSIIWGPKVTVNAEVSRMLSATVPAPDKVRVVGGGFGAGEAIDVIVVPPLPNFEGFPHQAAAVAATEADAQGAFSIDVDVTGLPLAGPNNQVIVLDGRHRPVAAARFTAP
jgi:hypothetical protein